MCPNIWLLLSRNNSLKLYNCIWIIRMSNTYKRVVLWLLQRDFRYPGSIKNALSLKHAEEEAETESFEGRRSVIRPTSDVTSTARNL